MRFPVANSAGTSTTEEETGKNPSSHNAILLPHSLTTNRPTKTRQQIRTKNLHCAQSADSIASSAKNLTTASQVANSNPSHNKVKTRKRETGRRDAGCEFRRVPRTWTGKFTLRARSPDKNPMAHRRGSPPLHTSSSPSPTKKRS